jgi:hypothetical protein
MSTRPIHRLVLRSPCARHLLLEPSGMALALQADDEVVVELVGVDPPELDLHDDRITIWGGPGSEITVSRGGVEIYSTVGNPVPGVPDGKSVRDFLGLAYAARR